MKIRNLSVAGFTLILIMLTLSTGCATMFGSSNDEISFDSEPQGAKVYFKGSILGTTPFRASIPRQSGASFITVEKEGFPSKNLMLQKSVDGVAFFNLFFISTTFGATSWGIDALNGSMFKYSPKSYVIELEKEKSTSLNYSSPLEYTIVHYERLREEIARSKSGEGLEGYCVTFRIGRNRCAGFLQKLIGERTSLIDQPHGLGFYRRVNALRTIYLGDSQGPSKGRSS